MECDNELSKFTSYFHNILERISNEKTTFKLATLTNEADGFNNSPSFKEFQRAINEQKSDEEYDSETTESEMIKYLVKILRDD